MPQEEIVDVKQPETVVAPFNDSAWSTSPTIPEPFKEEKKEPTSDVKDPVIADKDLEIKEEKPSSDKPNDPLKIPAATPQPVQDLPEEKKKEPEASVDLKGWFEEKEDEILTTLNQRKTLKNIDKLPHADVIKLQLKNENKDYSTQEVEDLFNEKFAAPEKPERDVLDTDDDFEAKEEKYKEQLAKYERKIERESKTAKAELIKQQQELVLPDIPQITPKPQEPTQEELAQFKKQQENFLQAVDGTFKDFNGYDATFKDGEVEIPVVYKVTKEEKEELKPLLDSLNTNLPQFFTQLDWIDKDGNLNVKKVVSDLHILKNKDNVIQKFVNEAGNKRYAEAIKSQKNVDFSGQQRKGNLEPSVREEVDKKVRGFLAAT